MLLQAALQRQYSMCCGWQITYTASMRLFVHAVPYGCYAQACRRKLGQVSVRQATRNIHTVKPRVFMQSLCRSSLHTIVPEVPDNFTEACQTAQVDAVLFRAQQAGGPDFEHLQIQAEGAVFKVQHGAGARQVDPACGATSERSGGCSQTKRLTTVLPVIFVLLLCSCGR